MITLNKIMPNGASCYYHRVHAGQLKVITESNKVSYDIVVNSYFTDNVFGTISWQDTYTISPVAASTITNIEEALLLTESFAGGSIVDTPLDTTNIISQ